MSLELAGECEARGGGWLKGVIARCEELLNVLLTLITGGLIERLLHLDKTQMFLSFRQHSSLLTIRAVRRTTDGINSALTGSTKVRHRFHGQD